VASADDAASDDVPEPLYRETRDQKKKLVETCAAFQSICTRVFQTDKDFCNQAEALTDEEAKLRQILLFRLHLSTAVARKSSWLAGCRSLGSLAVVAVSLLLSFFFFTGTEAGLACGPIVGTALASVARMLPMFTPNSRPSQDFVTPVQSMVKGRASSTALFLLMLSLHTGNW
jgi:hypothetical protein